MAQTLITNISSSLQIPSFPVGGGAPVSQVVYETPYLNFLDAVGRVFGPGGAAPYSLNAIVGGYTAAAHSEADTFTYDSETFARGTISPFYLRVTPGFSGHVRDNQNASGYYSNIEQLAIDEALLALRKKVEQNILGATAEIGISSLVDDTATCHGINPATYTIWKSLNTAVSGALTLGGMQDHYASATGPTYASRPDHILMVPTMLQNYALAGGDGQAGSLVQTRIQLGNGGVFDPGVMGMPMQFNGVPILKVLDLSNTQIIFANSQDIALKIHRNFTVDALDKTNDDSRWLAMCAAALCIIKRRSHSKISSLTA